MVHKDLRLKPTFYLPPARKDDGDCPPSAQRSPASRSSPTRSSHSQQQCPISALAKATTIDRPRASLAHLKLPEDPARSPPWGASPTKNLPPSTSPSNPLNTLNTGSLFDQGDAPPARDPYTQTKEGAAFASAVDVISALRVSASPERLEALGEYLMSHDVKRTGLVPVHVLRGALDLARFSVPHMDMKRLEGAYSLYGGIVWRAFMDDMTRPFETLPRIKTKTASTLNSVRFDEQKSLLEEVADFFRQRRIDVSSAFVDFDKPGKFCKKVGRVTVTQFEEALKFLTQGRDALTDRQVHRITDAYRDAEDGALVRYRDFVRDLDPLFEPSCGVTFSRSSPPTSPGARSPASSIRLGSPGSSGRASPTPLYFGSEAQSMGPHGTHSPARIKAYAKESESAEDILRVLRQKCKIFKIVLLDHVRGSDRLSEGTITPLQFRRAMDQLKVFTLSEREFAILEREYRVIISPTDVRFNYSKFCRDAQPTDPRAPVPALEMPMDERATSPLAVQDLEEYETQIVEEVLRRLADHIRNRRLSFRDHLGDFDRMHKTRHGTTPHNYTLDPGCISRAQFQQALSHMGCGALVSDGELALLFRRYERADEFNQIAFVRDMEVWERQSWAEADQVAPGPG